MLEVFRSKVMLLFIMVVFGVILIDCSSSNSLDVESSNDSMIVLNG